MGLKMLPMLCLSHLFFQEAALPKKPYDKPMIQRRSPEEIVERLFEIAGRSDTAAAVLKACISESGEKEAEPVSAAQERTPNPR
jgi:hypothetical protein